MAFFSEETLQAVRTIPIYDVVRSQVELSRSGRNWRGLSPFTQEKTPSFFVLTERNYFKCHSSGLAGDGIRFIQETEKLTFPEAVEALAERFGIEVRYASGGGPDPEVRTLRQALLDIHDYARDFYHQSFLADEPLAESVRNYWIEERGFSLDLAREYQIGFSPPDSRRLLQLLLKKGFSHEALASSGLFHAGRHPEQPESWFFVFRGRLMVPIRNTQGQVVAFTARQLEVTPRDHGSWKAKYINSPETPIFHKSQLLFNLDRARDAIKAADRLLMVEGQLDALRCWDCGLKEAIAPQGTSVTEDQIDLVKRYTDRLDVLLDRDDAGTRAILRLLPMAFQNRLQVVVIRLPEGADPDDFLRLNGMEGFEKLERMSGIHFAGIALLGEENPSPEARSKALHELFKILGACPSAVVREGYLEEAVAATGVSREAAYADFERFNREQVPRARPSNEEKRPQSGTNPSESLTNVEGDLLWAVLQNVALADPLAQVVDHQWIKTSTCEGKILSLILAQATVDKIEATDTIYFLLEDDAERDCFHRLLVDSRSQVDMLSYVNVSIASLARRYCRERVSILEQQITKIAQKSDNLSELSDLINEKNTLIRHLSKGPYPEIVLPMPSHHSSSPDPSSS